MTDKKRILVIDDAGPVVVLCVNVLQAQGYAVKGASRGETALELVSKETFDLIVVDYRMPGVTGFQVFTAAKAARPSVATILVTGHGTPEVVAEANRLGFDAILFKPFTSDELRSTVDKVLTART